MEKIIIEATKDTPRIILDKANCSIEIIGSSYPSNAAKVYTDIYDWLDEIDVSPNQSLHCEFYFTYLNSSSKSALFEILRKIDTMHQKHGLMVEILWKYDEFDDDMREVGKEFNIMMHEIEFKLLPQNPQQ